MADLQPQGLLRRKLRLGLLAGLGILLALLAATGIYATLSLNRLSRHEESDVRGYLSRSEMLQGAQIRLIEATNSIRDALLNSIESAAPAYRERAMRSWSEAMDAVRRYRENAKGRRDLSDALDSNLARYWEAANAGLRLEGDQRRKEGTGLYLRTLVPLRDKILATVAEIDSRDREQAAAEADRADQLARTEEIRLWIVIGAAYLLSLSVAVVTFKHIARMERMLADQYRDAKESARELERLSERLVSSHEDERRRIARDLHDDYGQRIASLIFELSGAAERSASPPVLQRAMRSMGERLGDLAKDLQQVSRSLHSAVLEKVGLEAAVRSDCDSLSARTSLSVNFRADGVPRKLPEQVALALYRVFQEASQNALKHSQTDRLDVSIAVEERELALRVRDFGRGLELKPGDSHDGLGLLSMRERLRMVGGVLTVRSEAGRGTEVEARAPLP